MKYGNKRTACALGHTHDSKREARACDDLHSLERAGVIHGPIEQQPRFKFELGGKVLKYASGRAVEYRADFAFFEGGKRIVADAKGFKTPEYKLKAALMAWFYNVEVREI